MLKSYVLTKDFNVLKLIKKYIFLKERAQLGFGISWLDSLKDRLITLKSI